MNSLQVEIQVDVEAPENIEETLMNAALRTLDHEDVDSRAGLSVLLTDDVTVRRLNRDFRDEDKVTDVLSFPTGEAIPGSGDYLGDIAISVAQAQAQADAAGHSLKDELTLLTIHGVLHLLGHDHAGDDEKERMWSAQQALLDELGLSITPPHG
jgi:probable rRNA maturation factor